MPSLYAKYILEREQKYIVEDDNGFATYYFVPDAAAVMIEDVYVVPEKRKSGIGAAYVEAISETAKANNYKALLTQVDPTANGSTTSLKAILGVGFKLHSVDKNLIYFIKEF